MSTVRQVDELIRSVLEREPWKPGPVILRRYEDSSGDVMDRFRASLSDALGSVPNGRKGYLNHLGGKLTESFLPTLAEIDCLRRLQMLDLDPIWEPGFPKKGPDVEVMHKGQAVGIEVTMAMDKSELSIQEMCLAWEYELKRRFPNRQFGAGIRVSVTRGIEHLPYVQHAWLNQLIDQVADFQADGVVGKLSMRKDEGELMIHEEGKMRRIAVSTKFGGTTKGNQIVVFPAHSDSANGSRIVEKVTDKYAESQLTGYPSTVVAVYPFTVPEDEMCLAQATNLVWEKHDGEYRPKGYPGPAIRDGLGVFAQATNLSAITLTEIGRSGFLALNPLMEHELLTDLLGQFVTTSLNPS